MFAGPELTRLDNLLIAGAKVIEWLGRAVSGGKLEQLTACVTTDECYQQFSQLLDGRHLGRLQVLDLQVGDSVPVKSIASSVWMLPSVTEMTLRTHTAPRINAAKLKRLNYSV